MSDNDKTAGGGEGIYGAAKEAVGSAAEQVRAAAPETYDAGVKAARYIGETASEHPFFLIGTAVIAFLGGLLSATANRDTRRPGWQERALNWRDRGYEMGEQARSAAPDVSKAAGDAGRYVSESVRENPVSGLVIAAAVGGILGYLLHNRS